MNTLNALTREAKALANGELTAPETEVARQLQICNFVLTLKCCLS